MYNRSRSFFDLCPRSLPISSISNSFFPADTEQIEVKLLTELSWDKGTQICRNIRGHMTKMAAKNL